MSSPSPRKSIDSFDSSISPSIRRVSEFPFPQHDPSRRPAAHARYHSRRSSNASVSSFASVNNSIGGALDIQSQGNGDTVREASQNAIATLLQPASARSGLGANSATTQKPPTNRDIPPVALVNIPHVENSAFRDYLDRIGPLLETFQRSRAEAEATASQVFTKDGEGKRNEELASISRRPSEDEHARPSPTRHGSLGMLTPTSSPHVRRRSSAYARRRANEPTPLSTIPGVYFEDNFQLENPRTFDVVSEKAEIVRQPQSAATGKQANGTAQPPRKALASNAILQEKLSWYMDTVEVHLINSISSASTSFFAALGSLRDLQQEAADSVADIQKLRADLAALDTGMASGGLEIASMRRKRENVRRLGHATAQVQRVVDQTMRCEELVDEGQYEAAADGINTVERLIAGEPSVESRQGDVDVLHIDTDLMDLRGLNAFQGLSQGIRQLRYRIGKGFEGRFMETLLSDLRRHVDKVPPKDTMRRWASAAQRSRPTHERVATGVSAYLSTDEQFRQDLVVSLNGLGRSGHTGQAAAVFREAVMKEMKALIRKHLPSSNDDDTESVTSVSTRAGNKLSQQDKSAILARNLRALDDEDAEALLTNVYTSVSEALRRLSVQVKVLLDVTSSFTSRPSSPNPSTPPRSPGMQTFETMLKNGRQSPSRARHMQDELSEALDLSSLLGQAVDVAQTQAARVLKVRAEQTHHLSLDRFLRYFTLNRLFADECEAISGRSGTMIKSIVNTQISAFVQTLADGQNQRIANLLEADQWDAKDVGDDDQAILSRILAGSTSDPPSWTRATRIWEDMPPAVHDTPVNGNGNSNGDANVSAVATTRPAIKPAYIDDNRYILINSAICLLPTLDTFLALIASISSIAPNAVAALADILRTFNSRSCQLILGAGATRSAGLKNITTKHLALASQALSFVIALIPYMREGVRRHAGGRPEILAEFDKTKRLYQEHQMGIHDKLVEIMTARANAHINSMKKIDFDAGGTGAASPYMETLTKETGTLYRVLSKHLAEPDVHGIMAQIFAGYQQQWSQAFSEVAVRTPGGKQKLLTDAELFESRLSRIDGFGDIGRELVKLVKGRDVSQEATTAENKDETLFEGK